MGMHVQIPTVVGELQNGMGGGGGNIYPSRIFFSFNLSLVDRESRKFSLGQKQIVQHSVFS